MPRANRFHIPGRVWHITQRCHNRAFLLRFARDRKRWRRWLFESKKRYGLCVLNYIVTRNHIHLLVYDTGNDTIARSMQLIAARVALEFNRRKSRRGAFWEDRYFATAVATDTHLQRCLVYIDLNMVRAGVVSHPAHWPISGYNEIQRPPQRYRIIDFNALCRLTGIPSNASFQAAHRDWVQQTLREGQLQRQSIWSEAVAVGDAAYVDSVRRELGVSAYHRSNTTLPDGTCVIEDREYKT